ncbi:MAG TPA: prepilin-type N-terminal cleavage/methylation domain-containing protein [Gemmatimonadales bacterium]|nr:prepilin-type N-terminal cleavage/methylation domain-containing protein [Gemmatimonadales bacterium]
MSLLGRRGYSIIELLIALVLLSMVSAAIYKVLVNNQRLYLAQTQTIDLNQNMRAAVTVLPAEFRELDAADGDIQAMTATSITIRAMRLLGFVCLTPPLGGGIGQLTLTIRSTPMYGNRQTFAQNDSLLVYWEGNPLTRSDDQWLPAQVKTVVTGPVCNQDTLGVANQGFALTMQPQWINNGGLNVANAITRGAPVRGFDNVTYAVYQSGTDNNWYLGQQNNTQGGGMQPVIGPLIGATGVTFSYYDSAGVVTAVPTQVAQIGIVLRARTASPIRDASGVQAFKVDSVLTRVALRNNPRCGSGGTAPIVVFRPCQ